MIDMAVAAFLSQDDIFAFREAQTTPLQGFLERKEVLFFCKCH